MYPTVYLIAFIVMNFRMLYETVELLNVKDFKEYTPGEPELFGTFLDSLMGFEKTY